MKKIKDTNYNKNNKCQCKKKITNYAKKCRKCADKNHSKNIKGKNNPMFGSSRKGKENPFYGKKHTKKTKKKMALYKIGKSLSEIHKKKISKTMKIIRPFKNKKHTKEVRNYFSKLAKLKIGKKNPNYKHGLSRFPYPLEFNDQLKYKIRTRDNFECQNCGMTEEEHLSVYGIVLCVHHIDYNKMNILPNNLISLCNDCHKKTNANRDYWYSYFAYIIELSKKER